MDQCPASVDGRAAGQPTEPVPPPETILLVDDESAVLRTYERLLEVLTEPDAQPGRPAVTIQKAGNGTEALAYLEQHPGCAVVVSDLKMPGIDGLTLLERVRALTPNAVRILSTAHADVHAAIEAINRTSIFRLLTKPCSSLALRTAIGDALTQHRLINAERDLLEQTVRGSVRALVEVLTLVDPTGSSRALRIHRHVQHVIAKLSLQDAWALEVAAMLSHLGSLALSSTDQPAEAANTGAVAPSDNQARVGADLLKHIPRFESVASIIARQRDPIDPVDAAVPLVDRDSVRRGGHILRAVIEFDSMTQGGLTRHAALEQMRHRPADFDRTAVDGLSDAELPERTYHPLTACLSDLRIGMILDEALRNPSGLLVMPRGQEISRPVWMRLQSLGSRQDLRQRVRVLTPTA